MPLKHALPWECFIRAARVCTQRPWSRVKKARCLVFIAPPQTTSVFVEFGGYTFFVTVHSPPPPLHIDICSFFPSPPPEAKKNRLRRRSSDNPSRTHTLTHPTAVGAIYATSTWIFETALLIW